MEIDIIVTYVHVMPVCSVGAPVVSGVALVLWLCVWDRNSCMQSYRAVMGKLFKEGAKGKEKNFRRANIIY